MLIKTPTAEATLVKCCWLMQHFWPQAVLFLKAVLKDCAVWTMFPLISTGILHALYNRICPSVISQTLLNESWVRAAGFHRTCYTNEQNQCLVIITDFRKVKLGVSLLRYMGVIVYHNIDNYSMEYYAITQNQKIWIPAEDQSTTSLHLRPSWTGFLLHQELMNTRQTAIRDLLYSSLFQQAGLCVPKPWVSPNLHWWCMILKGLYAS